MARHLAMNVTACMTINYNSHVKLRQRNTNTHTEWDSFSFHLQNPFTGFWSVHGYSRKHLLNVPYKGTKCMVMWLGIKLLTYTPHLYTVCMYVCRTDGRSVGWLDGRSVGRTVGRSVGRTGRQSVRRTDGRSVGRMDGRTVGRTDRRSVGRSVGLLV